MTTIPHHNIVVQQGPYALNILNRQIASLSLSELAESDQPEREALQRSVVHRLEELLRVTPIQEDSAGRDRNRHRGRAARRSPQEALREKASGVFVDTYV